MSQFYRAIGMNYVQYLNECTAITRNVVKEASKAKYATRELYYYQRAEFERGHMKIGYPILNTNFPKR